MTAQSSLLRRILDHKRDEVASRKILAPLDLLKDRMQQVPPVRDFAAALRKEQSVALIAEVKKASPSRGVLLEDFNHIKLAQTYMAHGAAALSVLTDVSYFQGSLTYLEEIRLTQSQAIHPDIAHMQEIPLLRKDFLLDPYQVYEARTSGADAVLLIVAALEDALLQELLELTHVLGMHALVEVHTDVEMERALQVGARIIGVNNRDLHTFTTDLYTTERLAAMLPTGAERPVLVSESGIHTAEDVARLRYVGVDAILVGEALVTAANIAARVRELAGPA
jgi:indole-3-glycerol phosphate synthase